MFEDVMVDLETLSIRPNGAILSIGAVEFDWRNQKLGQEFYAKCNLEEAMANGSVLPSTLEWWMSQEGDAKKEVFETPPPSSSGRNSWRKMMGWFKCWFQRMEAVNIWGNGATMDISMLEHAMKFDQPWSHHGVRDVRTIVEASEMDKWNFPFEGIEHHALHDARHQARYVMVMRKRIHDALESFNLADGGDLRIHTAS